MEKISAKIEDWKKSKPTLEGKRHVIQMFVGGMSQYLTDVQRMPKPVLDRLNVLARAYLWKDKHSPPVAFNQLLLPVEQGGLGLLDLALRNKALDIMWLKAYLDFSTERPWWAYIADDIFAKTVPAALVVVDEDLRVNPFLQHWSPLRAKLPPDLKVIIDTTKSCALRLEGRAFSHNIL